MNNDSKIYQNTNLKKNKKQMSLKIVWHPQAAMLDVFSFWETVVADCIKQKWYIPRKFSHLFMSSRVLI